MDTQMVVRVDTGLKKRFLHLSRTEGKTASQVVRELLERYVRDRDPAAHLSGLWDRIGAELTQAGARPGDVPGAIDGVRKAGR